MNNMAKKIIRLTEEELIKHIHKVVNEAINELDGILCLNSSRCHWIIEYNTKCNHQVLHTILLIDQRIKFFQGFVKLHYIFAVRSIHYFQFVSEYILFKGFFQRMFIFFRVFIISFYI